LFLSISTGCRPDLNVNVLESIHFLEHFSDYIDGVELLFARPEHLLEFEFDKRALEFIQQLKISSLHMPFIGVEYKDNTVTNKLLEKARRIDDKIGIQYFVFHPNNVKDFKVLDKVCKACIENTSNKIREKTFSKLEGIRKVLEGNPKIGFVLDVCHAMITGSEPMDFLKFENRLKAVHISSVWKRGGELRQHGFLVEAEENQLSKIKPIFKAKVPFVVESIISPEKNIMKRELAFLREQI